MLVCFCFVFGSLFSWYFLFLVCFFVYFFALFSRFVLLCFLLHFFYHLPLFSFIHSLYPLLYSCSLFFPSFSFSHFLSISSSLSFFFLPHYSKSSFPDLKNYSSIFVYYFVMLSLLQSAITINPTQWLSKIERKDRKNYIIPLFAINYIWIFFFLYTFLF